jgi:hypothetical protein
VWKDGVKVVDYSGSTLGADTGSPYIYRKFGVYSHGTNPDGQTSMYFDEFRFGDEDSSYEEVAPGRPEPAPPEQPQNLRILSTD